MDDERFCIIPMYVPTSIRQRYLPAVVVIAAVCSMACAEELGIHAVGGFDLPTQLEGLSGITRIATGEYMVVDDSGGTAWPLDIQINPTDGSISSVVVGSSISLAGSDLEAVAWRAQNQRLYTADETGATIRRHRLDGTLEATETVPAIYNSYRGNFSLESLTIRDDGLVMWTANEEALYNPSTGVNDGPLSSTSAGTVVRLQRFGWAENTATWQPTGQWAYVTDPIASDSWATDQERSGIADLCVLPSGALLVLERQLNGNGALGLPAFRNSIYEISTAAATDTSAVTSLDGASYTPASKRLVWQGDFALENYEGLCLGKKLSDGSYSLLMISDGDDEPLERLYSLRLTGPVEPIPGDTDRDGDVDSVDLAALGLHWCPGCSLLAWADGDFDGDGDVDPVDLAQLGLHWSPGRGIPEPATLTALLTGWGGLTVLGGRR